MKPITLPGIDAYAARCTTPDPAPLVALAAETWRDLDLPQMMVGPVEARFLQMLVFALRPRLVLEIGTFTGYSALSMAAVLPAGGRIVTCEASERHAAVARRHVAASPHADRITIELGPALDTIARLDGPFDFVFIDADQVNYHRYLEAVLPKLSPAGLVAADNTLWNGDVVGDRSDDVDAIAIRHFNDAVVADPHLSSVLLTLRDGVTLIRPASA
jgi:caffeoyl-CoA O-methyltransferase